MNHPDTDSPEVLRSAVADLLREPALKEVARVVAPSQSAASTGDSMPCADPGTDDLRIATDQAAALRRKALQSRQHTPGDPGSNPATPGVKPSVRRGAPSTPTRPDATHPPVAHTDASSPIDPVPDTLTPNPDVTSAVDTTPLLFDALNLATNQEPTSRRLVGLKKRLVALQQDEATSEDAKLFFKLLGYSYPDTDSVVIPSDDALVADWGALRLAEITPGLAYSSCYRSTFEGTRSEVIKLLQTSSNPSRAKNGLGEDLFEVTLAAGGGEVTRAVTRTQIEALTEFTARSIYSKHRGPKVFFKTEKVVRAYLDEKERVDNGEAGLFQRIGTIALTPSDAIGTLAGSMVVRGRIEMTSRLERWNANRRGAVGAERSGGAAVMGALILFSAYRIAITVYGATKGVAVNHSDGSTAHEIISTVSPSPIETRSQVPASPSTSHTKSLAPSVLAPSHTTHTEAPTPRPSTSPHTPSPSSTEHTSPSHRPNIPGTSDSLPLTHANVRVVESGDTISEIAAQELRAEHAPTTNANIASLVKRIAKDSGVTHAGHIVPGQKLHMEGAHRIATGLSETSLSAGSHHGTEIIPKSLANQQTAVDDILHTPVRPGAGVLDYLMDIGVKDPSARRAFNHMLNTDPQLAYLRQSLTAGTNPPMYTENSELRFSRPGQFSQHQAEQLARILSQASQRHQQELIDAAEAVS